RPLSEVVRRKLYSPRPIRQTDAHGLIGRRGPVGAAPSPEAVDPATHELSELVMSKFRFVHAADIHLDSPMRGLEADPEAPAALIRDASRAAFRNLIDMSIEERVAFVLIAGD